MGWERKEGGDQGGWEKEDNYSKDGCIIIM